MNARNRDIRTISELERKEIIDLYESSQTISAISKKLNIHRRAIRNILKSVNVYKVNKYLDLTGKTFGYLKVTGMTIVYNKRRKQNETMAICECSNCNNPRQLVRPINLKRGSTISCGCYREQYKKLTG